MIKSGELKHQIEIERPVATTTATGSELTQWQLLRQCKAKVVPIGSAELLRNKQFQDNSTTRFIIRYSSQVDSSCRIIWNGELYNLTSVVDTEARHQEMVITGTANGRA